MEINTDACIMHSCIEKNGISKLVVEGLFSGEVLFPKTSRDICCKNPTARAKNTKRKGETDLGSQRRNSTQTS